VRRYDYKYILLILRNKYNEERGITFNLKGTVQEKLFGNLSGATL